MKVWIVDDESEIRQILKYILEREGFETQCFENPLAAIENLKKSKPDVVVSDFRMPQMNGLDFFKAIQGNWSGCFIMLTGEPSADVDEFKKIGIKEVLFKPKDLNILANVIKSHQT
ncbi:MAG: response regulator [Bacteriovoracaceae bacterium]|nr:response regulator [Bacteriovoracaceae bacterium]